MKYSKQVWLVGVMLVCSIGTADASIWPFGKKNKKSADTTVVVNKGEKSKSKYEKLFGDKEKCITAEGDFMTLHKVDDKLYAEMDNDLFGRDVLIATTISEISDPSVGSVGYKPEKPIHCRFVKRDQKVYLNQVTIQPDHKESPEMSEAVRRNNIDAVMMAPFEAVCQSPDSTATVFEITPLFMSDFAPLSAIPSKSSGGISVSATYNPKMSHMGEIKAFEDNVSVRSWLSYKVNSSVLGLLTLKKNQPTSVLATRTILLLPEEPARERVADSRVGIFLSNRTTFDAPTDYSDTYSVIHRWRVEPADEEAYARGELVEPKKPIVFYLDDAFPAELRAPAKYGIERWNKAFEKIGFKNVVRVVDFPKDDPEFDPDNLKYSCIRWLPSTTANAMGPSWVDPRSGEIINASVIVYSNVVKTIHNWRFVQTAQVDERVRSLRLNEEVRDESWAYVLAHEVGHCLGFMHNMAASASVPVESLRDVEYTNKYGTTSSIMDYARFNYVAQPEDKGVKLTPPDLGEYDYWLVEYAYKPVPEAENAMQEAKVLEQWVAAKSGDKRFRYGRQQNTRIDPSAIEEDLSDDPIKASQYGVQNLKYIMANFGEWFDSEVDSYGKYREELYNGIVQQYNRYVEAVLLNVGGIYLTSTHADQASQRAVPVDADYQREALRWAMQRVDDCEWLEDRSLTDMFRLRTSRADVMAYNHTLAIFKTYKATALCSHIAPEGEAFTMQDWIKECSDWVWKPTRKGGKVDAHQRMKQRLWVSMLAEDGASIPSYSSASLTSLAEQAYTPSLDHIVAFGLDESGNVERYEDIYEAIENEQGCGFVGRKLIEEEIAFGPAGYGMQKKVNVKVVDESKMYLYGELLRTKDLLAKAVKNSSGETKTHYQTLLNMVEKALEGKK